MSKLDPNYILGALHANGEWQLYLAPIAYWILDYPKYDPTIEPSNAEFPFRQNLLVVNVSDEHRYLESMKEFRLDLNDLSILAELKESWQLALVMDFEKKIFVNGFFDTALEDYVPVSWKAMVGDPVSYVPPAISESLAN